MPRPLAALLCLFLATPAAAQWVAVGRWGSEGSFRYVAPGTWMVQDSGANGVEISVEGDNHVGRLTLWCRADMPGGGLVLTHYYGTDLRQTLRDPAQIESEVVTFVLGDQSFDLALDLIEWERTWIGHDVLDADFLAAFARTNRLELRNAEGASVTGFRMSGSSAALGTLRRRCGI